MAQPNPKLVSFLFMSATDTEPSKCTASTSKRSAPHHQSKIGTDVIQSRKPVGVQWPGRSRTDDRDYWICRSGAIALCVRVGAGVDRRHGMGNLFVRKSESRNPKPMKRRPTKAERAYMTRVAELGCVICGCPAEIHHCRAGQGLGQRATHIGGVIPLCPMHHRSGGHGIAFHAGKRTWQDKFGTEAEHLQTVEHQLKENQWST